MAKINPNKKIQKHRTEDEMRMALKRLPCASQPQVDDDDIVLTDVIEELLEARQTLEEVRGFAQRWVAKDTRR